VTEPIAREDSPALPPVFVASANRGIWYHATGIDIDYASISAYYDSLQYSGKPRLEDCRIHISPLACIINSKKFSFRRGRSAPEQSVGYPPPPRMELQVDSVHLLEPDDAALFDPMAPPADIVLFLGFSIMFKDPSRVISALERQLAAYARGKEAWPHMSDEEKQLRDELTRQALRARGKSSAVIGAVEGAVEEGVPSIISLDSPMHILISIGVGVAEHALESSGERKAFRKLRNKLLTCIRTREAAIRPETPSASLSPNAIQFPIRKDDRVQAVCMRLPFGRRWPGGSTFDYAIDKTIRQRSLHQLPLKRPI
jgi:hypothetical protein